MKALIKRQDQIIGRRGAAAEARRMLFARRSIPGLQPRRWPAMLAVAALAAALVALVMMRPWSSAPDGAPLAVTDQDVMRFEDGTMITLKPGARARVERRDERGATIIVEQGSLYAAVVKHSDARWSFHAGPYVVTVTGTAFDLSWTPPTLRIVMHQGSVEVSGPDIDVPRAIVAGQSAVFPAAVDPAPAPAGTANEGATSASPAASPSDTATAPSSASSTVSADEPTWQQRAAEGDHKAAFRAVAPRLDAELSTLDAGSMVRLATVARLSGHPGAARRVYLKIRERFAGTPSAAEAAFSLGGFAFASNGAEAERWLRLFLVEAPGSGLASAARGRLLELAIRRGDGRAAADEYLRHHPDGSHAALARDTLGQ